MAFDQISVIEMICCYKPQHIATAATLGQVSPCVKLVIKLGQFVIGLDLIR